MKYDPVKKEFVIPVDDMQTTAGLLLEALRSVRETAGLPLDRYEKTPGLLTPADHAQKNILDAAELLGVDFRARWGNELDLRK